MNEDVHLLYFTQVLGYKHDLIGSGCVGSDQASGK